MYATIKKNCVFPAVCALTSCCCSILQYSKDALGMIQQNALVIQMV